MIIFITREVLPDKEVLSNQFKFLTPEDIHDIYEWIEEEKEFCIPNGNNSSSTTIQQVYKYSGVIITNDYLSEFRTWPYHYDRHIFQEEYTSVYNILRIYKPPAKKALKNN